MSWRRDFIMLGKACLLAASVAFGEEAAEQPVNEEPITEADRDHWSFQPILRPQLPSVQQTDWPATPIDYFVLHRLERAKTTPAPQADSATLLRRLKFNLLGLPPTPDEVVAFENDATPEAYRQLVDRMLPLPAYGERQAQYWLDLARFAETDGFEHDKVRKDAWKYRQWIVDALNRDMPYDQFVKMQLAGDLSGRSEDTIATMFCLAGPDMPDINEQDVRRHDKLNEITSTIGSALLGLQLHCAQCHDHKYDPISQADFYRLRGVFEASIPEMRRDKPVLLLSTQPKALTPWIFFRGEASKRGPAVSPRPPRIVSSSQSPEAFDTGDPRLALVDWLFAKDNTLTARVIANRTWQRHFGKSLCENPADFGMIAGGPSHPELLDWLATELRQNNWSIKHLDRLILLSATYQQASRLSSDSATLRDSWQRTLKADPENELYGRFPRKRLEGEVIRDALLSASGQLNDKFGGPSVMPPLPKELSSTLLRGQWKTDKTAANHLRRGIYVFARRNLRYPIFDVFDRPNAGASCARRDQSTTAIQSLQMLNGDLAFQAAQHLRDRLLQQGRDSGNDSPEELIDQLFLTVFSRHPSSDEATRFRTLLESSTPLAENLLSACVAMFNASEFVYVD